jgi:hypothetical protein
MEAQDPASTPLVGTSRRSGVRAENLSRSSQSEILTPPVGAPVYYTRVTCRGRERGAGRSRAVSKPDFKSGQTVPKSGQYPIVGPRGGDTGQEVTATKGEPFPPVPEKGMGFGKPDLTK